MEGTGETDWPAEQRGFEPPVPLAWVRVIFGEEKGPEVISVVSKNVVVFQGGPAVPSSESATQLASCIAAAPRTGKLSLTAWGRSLETDRERPSR